MNQPDPAARQIEIGGLAVQFHEAYERLAPAFGWTTQEASAVEWKDLPTNQKLLMEAVVNEVCSPLLAALATERAEKDELIEAAHQAACVMCVDSGACGDSLVKNRVTGQIEAKRIPQQCAKGRLRLLVANYHKATGPQAENEEGS